MKSAKLGIFEVDIRAASSLHPQGAGDPKLETPSGVESALHALYGERRLERKAGR